MIAESRTRTTDKRFYGVVEGIVTDVNDPKKEGRAKVKFPWFDDQMETEWCRVQQFYAGNGYGAFFVPEVGDEVVVAFIHGDMRLPVILGGLYNGQDKPASDRSSDKDQKLIRTKGQHEILMDDSNGKQRVRIKTKAGHSVDLNDQDHKIEIKSTNGHSVTLDDSGNKITVETSTGQSITMEGGSIKLSATSVIVNAATIKLGGDAATQSLVLGEMLLATFNAHTHIITLPGTPSAPPLPPLTPAALSMVSKTS